MTDKCFVLFSLKKNFHKLHSFDPSMCGIFLDASEAKKSQDILSSDGRYLTFILELPLSRTSNDWLEYSKQYIRDKMSEKTYRFRNNNSKTVEIEYKINRKKVLKNE